MSLQSRAAKASGSFPSTVLRAGDSLSSPGAKNSASQAGYRSPDPWIEPRAGQSGRVANGPDVRTGHGAILEARDARLGIPNPRAEHRRRERAADTPARRADSRNIAETFGVGKWGERGQRLIRLAKGNEVAVGCHDEQLALPVGLVRGAVDVAG